jgi:general secretion pathway protein A
MFLEFFGLREQPFGVTPDPRFLYLSVGHRQVLTSMYRGIEADRDFLGLIAKPGMGKTTILFHLMEKFRAVAHTAFIFQTQCNSREFLHLLLGYEGDSHELKRRLLAQARAGQHMIIVIDEAQNLMPEVLETLRLLSASESATTNLLHVILCGQPRLAGTLEMSGLAQLRLRGSILNLEPLSSAEIKNYIDHRLAVAGYQGNPLFTPEVYQAIATFSQGIPRDVNNFCFNALSLSYAVQKKVVDMDLAAEVMNDLDISRSTGGARVEEETIELPSPPGPRPSFTATAPAKSA